MPISHWRSKTSCQVVGAQAQAHVPLLHVADAARVLELQAGDEGDVAEAGVADDEHDRLACLDRGLRRALHVREVVGARGA